VVQLDPGIARGTPRAVRLLLERPDVEMRPTWKPLHLRPVVAGAATGNAC